MPTAVELKLKRGQLGTEAHSILTKAACTKEDRAKAATMLDEADGLTSQIELLERSDKLEDRNRQRNDPPRPDPDANDYSEAFQKQYRVSFEMYFRFGESALMPEDLQRLNQGSRATPTRTIMIAGEKRDITEAATGNYIVPQEFYNELVAGKKFIGEITGAVKRKRTPGNGAPMKIGFENDTANTIQVIGENTSVTETDPALSGLISSTDTLGTLIKVSKQEMADSGFDLAALFRNRLGLRYGRGIENFIANGDGVNIQSLLGAIFGGTQGTNYTVTSTNAGPGYEDFVACQLLLDPIYEKTAAWFMHKSTRNYVMSLLDTLNRPLFLPNPQTGMLDQILGYPVKLSAYMPMNAAQAQSVVYGDMEEGYLLRDDGEMTIQRLDERFATELMVGFLAYTRVGGVVTNPGTNPLVGMQVHS